MRQYVSNTQSVHNGNTSLLMRNIRLEGYGHTIVKSPPNMCDLNPTELAGPDGTLRKSSQNERVNEFKEVRGT
jgi:hypothetical protein